MLFSGKKRIPVHVFAGKMTGDSAAILPKPNQLLTWIAGMLTYFYTTDHSRNHHLRGLEIFVYNGIKTVNKKGDVFTTLVT